MKRLFPFLAMLPGFVGLADGAMCVHSFKDMAERSDAEYAHGIAFSVTGTVVASIQPFGHVVENDGIRLRTYFPGEGKPDVGDVIGLCGLTSVTNRRSRHLTSTHWQRIRHTPPPAPESVTIRQIRDGMCNLHAVRTAGTVSEFFLDGLDERFAHLFLTDDGQSIDIGIRRQDFSEAYLRSLVNARIRVQGTCVPNAGGWRMHTGPIILGISEIRLLTPAPDDPFDAPALPAVSRLSPSAISKLGRRHAVGRVCARWRGNRILIRTGDNARIRVQLVQGARPPPCGATVRAVGLVDTDTANIMLTSALWKMERDLAVSDDKPRDITSETMSRMDFPSAYDGQLATVRGTVIDVPHRGTIHDQMLLDCQGHIIPIDASGFPEYPGGIEIGSEIQVTGIFLAETDTWSRNAPFPQFKGFVIIPRTAGDLRVLARPPWWTVPRLAGLVITLLVALSTVFLWNRILRHLVERKCRQLFKEQVARVESEFRIEERTRLAVELHDSLSQNLTGITLELNAADRMSATNPSGMRHHLNIAIKALNACREELRNCIWDLRSHALESDDMESAIRQTLKPHVGSANLSIRFAIPRKRISDNTAHAILRIIRELAVNAVNHGHAASLRIAGSIENEKLLFSVRDDGCGFDPDEAPGAAQGHFGLLGVRERVEGLEGEMQIESSRRGGGTRVTVSLNIPQPQNADQDNEKNQSADR